MSSSRGSEKVVGFNAAFRRGGLWQQDLEHAPWHANDAFIFAHPNAELDGGTRGVPPSVGRKTEEDEIPPMEAKVSCSCNVLKLSAKGKGVVERFVGTGGRPR
jgi:hypothetical protein